MLQVLTFTSQGAGLEEALGNNINCTITSSDGFIFGFREQNKKKNTSTQVFLTSYDYDGDTLKSTGIPFHSQDKIATHIYRSATVKCPNQKTIATFQNCTANFVKTTS